MTGLVKSECVSRGHSCTAVFYCVDVFMKHFTVDFGVDRRKGRDEWNRKKTEQTKRRDEMMITGFVAGIDKCKRHRMENKRK